MKNKELNQELNGIKEKVNEMQKENERVVNQTAQKAQLEMDLILQKAQASEIDLKRELKNACCEKESLKLKLTDYVIHF